MANQSSILSILNTSLSMLEGYVTDDIQPKWLLQMDVSTTSHNSYTTEATADSWTSTTKEGSGISNVTFPSNDMNSSTLMQLISRSTMTSSPREHTDVSQVVEHDSSSLGSISLFSEIATSSFNQSQHQQLQLFNHSDQQLYPDDYDLNVASTRNSFVDDFVTTESSIGRATSSEDYFFTSEPPVDHFVTSYSPTGKGISPGIIHGASLEVVMKVLVLSIISLLGSIGNVFMVWSVVRDRHLHRPPFYFLLSLGVTDLSRAVFCIPVVVTTVLRESTWRHGDSACKLFAFATSFFVFSSALSLLAISMDRHISIVYSKTYRRRSNGVANLVVAIIIWVIAFCVSFPPVLGIGDYIFIPGEAHCAFQHKHFNENDAVASVFVFIAILFLACFLYFRIFKFLRAHRRMRPLQHQPARSTTWAFVGAGANGQAFINWLNGFGGQAPIRQGGQRAVQRLNFGRVVNLSTARNEHLTRLFLVLTLVFGAMWTPYVVLSLWRIFGDATVLPTGFVTAAAWMGYGQTALCPIVYFLAKGPTKRQTRAVYSPDEKKEFLLENKIRK